jgi:hypothetical protein
MKMKVNGNIVEDDVSIEGLLECKLSHHIKETKGTVIYTGPKIPPEVWNEVLSFFKWCYTTYKSECQVRLFVSPTQNTWRAWAFPQEAKTGMTAREIDNEDARTQRAELNMNPPDWIYFGTVHHHCGAGAFQSGTDEENEKNQDGLHITVGKMDEKKHDLHARFYRKGLKFTPDLSWFFDVEPALEQVRTWMASSPVTLDPKINPTLFLGHKDKDDLAKSLMCEPSEVEFPQAWKDNIIEIRPVTPTYPVTPYFSASSPAGSNGTTHGVTHVPSVYSPDHDPVWQRTRRAWSEILFHCVVHEIAPEDIESAIGDLALKDFAPNVVVMACRHHKVDPDDLEREMPTNLAQAIVEEAMSQAQERHERTAPTPKQNTSTPRSQAKSEGKKADGEAPASGTVDGDDWSHLSVT